MRDEGPVRLKRQELEALGTGLGIRCWSLQTTRTLDEVLSPGYFLPLAGYGVLASHDRIFAATSLNSGTPEYSDLVVTTVIKAQKEDKDRGVPERQAAIVVRPLRWEEPASTSKRAA